MSYRDLANKETNAIEEQDMSEMKKIEMKIYSHNHTKGDCNECRLLGVCKWAQRMETIKLPKTVTITFECPRYEKEPK